MWRQALSKSSCNDWMTTWHSSTVSGRMRARSFPGAAVRAEASPSLFLRTEALAVCAVWLLPTSAAPAIDSKASAISSVRGTKCVNPLVAAGYGHPCIDPPGSAEQSQPPHGHSGASSCGHAVHATTLDPVSCDVPSALRHQSFLQPIQNRAITRPSLCDEPQSPGAAPRLPSAPPETTRVSASDTHPR